MKVSLRRFCHKYGCWLLLPVLLLAGCSPAAAPRKRFFWPIGTGQPRIEYLNYYLGEQDLKRGVENPFSDAVFGRERPVPVFQQPHAIAVKKDEVLVSDLIIKKVVVLDFSQKKIRYLKDAKGRDYLFRRPIGIAVAPRGTVLVVDAIEHRVDVFSAADAYLKSFGQNHLSRPTGIAVSPDGQQVWVVDTGAHRLVHFDGDGNYLGEMGARGVAPGMFNFPLDADFDAEGNLYVLDAMNARVQVFSPQGKFLRAFGGRGTQRGLFRIPKSLAVSRTSGLIYVTDSMANDFIVFDLQGRLLLTVGGHYASNLSKVVPGGMNLPKAIAVDKQDGIWVVDGLNRMVHRFQYLTPAYLEKHPILPGERLVPTAVFKSTPAK
ncbi:hypothetical protein B5V00_03890 [Geothermobacter hydrogeniphilus]|uniref:NHL repeat-containing protein n=1 Tax=Geothermobacter hydrogeniphilus TaxID=1969733 RepID=A0A1X0YBD9_9BACT|nr:hypothetical protein B5V00_03890 [Geothermobacter hydrogeniphilus]